MTEAWLISLKEQIVAALWDLPGQSWQQLATSIGETNASTTMIREAVDCLISERKVTIVRFTSYAPNLTTSYFLMPTQVGQIEIVNDFTGEEGWFNGPFVGYTYDPIGEWDARMEASLSD